MGDIFGIGATVQGAASATAAGLNYKAQKDYNEKYLQGVQETNQLNRELAEKQNAWNLEQWRREIAYNDPSQQVQRLRSAGLSAAAAAQSLEGAGNAAGLQSVNLANQQAPSPMQAPQLDVSGMNIIGVARALEDLRQSQLTTKKLQNEVDFQVPFLGSELDAKNWANKLSMQLFENTATEFPYKVEKLKYDVESGRLGNAALKIANRVAKTQHKLLKQQYKFLEDWNDKQIKEVSEKIANLIAERDNIKKQGKVLNAQVENIQASTESIQKDVEVKDEQKKLFSNEAFSKELQNVLTLYGCPESQALKIAAFVSSKHLNDGQLIDFLHAAKNYLKYGRMTFYKDGDKPTDNYIQLFFEGVLNEGERSMDSYGFHQLGPWRAGIRKVAHP